VTEIFKPHVLFLTFHLPLGHEPGAFRPGMEARLLAQAGFRVTVITSGVHYMTGEDIRPRRAAMAAVKAAVSSAAPSPLAPHH
jgi:hypothetical protein